MVVKSLICYFLPSTMIGLHCRMMLFFFPFLISKFIKELPHKVISSYLYFVFYLSLQIVTLIIKALAWCCMFVVIGLETMVYVCEVRWFVRFGVLYVLLGDAVLFNLVLSVSTYYSRLVFMLLERMLLCLVGILTP